LTIISYTNLNIILNKGYNLFHKENFGKSIKYFDSSLIALILSILTTPMLWYILKGSTTWVLSCSLLWGVGVFAVFYPSIKFLFPFLLTKMGTFALTNILAMITILFNSILITMLLPTENIEIIMNRIFFDTSISTISLFILFYVIITSTLVVNMHININHILYRQRKLMRQIFTLSEYYKEIIFVSVLPIALLFWTDITYSFRVFLGILSIGVGMSMFILKVEIKKLQQKILLSTLSAITILVIDGAMIHLFGMNTLPTNSIIQTSKDKHSFQLSSSKNSDNITVYQILASIPQIGLRIGHKIASIPNREITVEATKSQYTIHDQYNDKVLLNLDR